MNFFEHQDRARRQTGVLVCLFTLAVVCLIALTNLLVVVVLASLNGVPLNDWAALEHYLSWQTLAKTTVAIVGVVLLAAIFKLSQLRGGGRAVAESMGGQLINHSSADANERKVLNVVEEIAIASGTPVPPVYILEESAVNAFAAGYKPADAVIGITRGCINLLSRDELQGVVAHEFSHILHGDMRLNLRLVGVLHGILVIGILGYWLLRSVSRTGYRPRSKNNSALPFLALGGGLMVIGYAGTFFGNLIKAAVSRQREYLADASAVQFTRNPDGIGGALKKIGGFDLGSRLDNPNASEISHLFFGQAVQPFLGSLMATHPPLAKRIQRIEPGWNGEYSIAGAGQTGEGSGFDDEPVFSQAADLTEKVAGFAGYPPVAVPLKAAEQAVDDIGRPQQPHIDYAQQLLTGLPETVREVAHDPFAARALVYLLLLDEKEPIRQQQWQLLKDNADQQVYRTLQEIQQSYSPGVEHRLPLIDLVLPGLKQLSPRQYQGFRSNIVALMRADREVELFEWALFRILLHNLEPQRTGLGGRGSIGSLKLVRRAITLVLSALADSGAESPQAAERSFNAARDYLNMPRLQIVARSEYQLKHLSQAITVLNRLKPLLKPRLLKAMCACVAQDGQVLPLELELLRAFADSLDCPMPPILGK